MSAEDVVSYCHPDHREWLPVWTSIRDFKAGERAVKEKGEAYLIKPGGYSEAAYADRKRRARVPEAVSPTINLMLNRLFQEDPQVSLPAKLDYMHDRVMSHDAFGVDQLTKLVADEVITVGRYGLLVDYYRNQQGGNCYLTGFKAEQIINWQMSEGPDGQGLSLVVLKQYRMDGALQFAQKAVPEFLVLALDENGRYYQQLYEKAGREDKYIAGERVYPASLKGPLDYIPFVFCSTNSATTEIQRPLFDQLVGGCIHSYETSSSARNALHLIGEPTPVFAADWEKMPQNQSGQNCGSGTSDGPYYSCGPAVPRSDCREGDIRIGSDVAIQLPEGGNAFYLEINGQGLEQIRKEQESIRDELIAHGARMLKPITTTQTATSDRLQENTEISRLGAVAAAIESSVNKALVIAGSWIGLTDSDIDRIQVSISKKYSKSALSPAELKELGAAFGTGVYSNDVFVRLLKNHGLVAGDVDADEYFQDIQDQSSAALVES